MKKIFCFTFLLIICLLTGCGNEAEKMCRIEIQDENNVCIAILEQKSQADIITFLDEEHWEEYYDATENLEPEYVITLYQEKTHTIMQKEEKNTYEKITEYTIYKNSDVIKESISEDVIKSGLVSDEYLTTYYIGSEKFFSSVNDVFN